MLKNNRLLTLYTAQRRTDKVLKKEPLHLQDLFKRFDDSRIIPMTHAEYTALPKAQQDNLKDVGAFIAGELKDGWRRSDCIISRSAAVIDADNIPSGGTDDFIRRVFGLGMCCCVYSTAKHSPATPRLRVVIPFSAEISADQYNFVVRALCQMIQPEMTYFDPTTAESNRLMFYPAHCEDITPVYQLNEGSSLLDSQALTTNYPNWQDMTNWAKFPKEADPVKLADKQQDPETKKGVVGAFCRVYDIPAAMDKFLAGVYEETSTEGRYTFTGGSTAGGAVLYDNGKFLYSHHATDPCSGKLVNAFDLVRLHKFRELDNSDEVKPNTPTNRLPSYAAMEELAKNDPAVSDILARERIEAAVEDFQNVASEDAALELGHFEKQILTEEITELALKAFGISIRYNSLNDSTIVEGLAGYSKENAVNILPIYLMDKLRAVGIKGVNKSNVADYLSNIADKNRFNPISDMLNNLQWDGVPRFEEFLKMLGVPSDSFYAMLIRKWLIQAIVLADNTIEKNIAAEGVLTLKGEQGIGKSTVFRKLALNNSWFTGDLVLDVRNKDSLLKATSVWIAELGELDSTLKREQSALKAFLTSTTDKIRAPYAREATLRPRITSFAATVNPDTFLKDETGDRRFWIVPVNDMDTKSIISLSKEWIMQLWAEIFIKEKLVYGFDFHLTRAERKQLDALNAEYRVPLIGEEELLQLFNWDLPPEKWGQFTSTDVRQQILTGERITSQQVGRALAKIAREDSRIKYKVNSRSRVKTYTLPLIRSITNYTNDFKNAAN